jgi:S1-C subfamily serine protease
VKGVLVVREVRGSPAYDVGIVPGDIIVSVNGQDVSDPSELYSAILKKDVGDVVVLEVVRGGRRYVVHVRLDEAPTTQMAA